MLSPATEARIELAQRRVAAFIDQNAIGARLQTACDVRHYLSSLDLDNPPSIVPIFNLMEEHAAATAAVFDSLALPPLRPL